MKNNLKTDNEKTNKIQKIVDPFCLVLFRLFTVQFFGILTRVNYMK